MIKNNKKILENNKKILENLKEEQKKLWKMMS